MKGESVTRVGSNQRVCWERLKGESRTDERRVGNGTLKPRNYATLLVALACFKTPVLPSTNRCGEERVPNTPFALSQHASPASSTCARSTHPSRNQHVQHSAMTQCACRVHFRCSWKLCYAAGCTCVLQDASAPKHEYTARCGADARGRGLTKTCTTGLGSTPLYRRKLRQRGCCEMRHPGK